MARVCKSHRVLVGMEIHVQLATRSKMFTSAANGAAAPVMAGSAAGGGDAAALAIEPPAPNTLVDAVVLGLPGVLPVMNKRAVEMSIKVGLALGCEIAKHTKWDRKSYFYPDLPKNYQISQYDLPLCFGGLFHLEAPEGGTVPVRIRRAHLEEDAGKLLHEAPGGHAIDHSIVDLNRAGTPLLEVVTEPDLSSGAEVAAFGRELQRLVQFLGVSGGQMQLGQMRFEPNINVHITDEAGEVHKTAITEIKNLNSFSVLERATDYEARRQVEEWLASGSLGQKSTRGWDEARGQTFLQRTKEEAHDYRYFPDPDLMPVEVDEEWLEAIRAEIGELPQARRARYAEKLDLAPRDAAILAADRETGDLFERVIALGAEPKRASALMEALREMANARNAPLLSLGVSADSLAAIAMLVADGKVAAGKEVAKELLAHIAEHGGDALSAATALGRLQSNDTGAVDAAIDALLAHNPKPLQDYKAGKQSALGALVGMVMKNDKGLNAKMVQERLKERLA